jgi:hypothetical protein
VPAIRPRNRKRRVASYGCGGVPVTERNTNPSELAREWDSYSPSSCDTIAGIGTVRAWWFLTTSIRLTSLTTGVTWHRGGLRLALHECTSRAW